MAKKLSEPNLGPILERIGGEFSPLFLQEIASESDPKRLDVLIRNEFVRVLNKIEERRPAK